MGRRDVGLPPSAYHAYIASPAWEARKQWWRSHRPAPRQRRCRVCHVPPPYDLHHRTYVRLGCERLRDLVPLCRRHHDRLGNLQRRYGYSVEKATRIMLFSGALRRAGRGGLVAALATVALTVAIVAVR